MQCLNKLYPWLTSCKWLLNLTFVFIIIFQQSCLGDCLKQAKVATKFMNAYVRDLNSPSGKGYDWVKKNVLVTETFKISLERIISDPNFNADPILSAQDYPDRGFEFDSCKSQPQFVTLRGISWKSFKVVVKVIRRKNRWFIDGSGVVNIPENKQARFE